MSTPSEKPHNESISVESDVDFTEQTRYLAYANRLTQIVKSSSKAFSGMSRYLAYTSDVGEAARPVVHPNIVRLTYGISWGYVLVDVGLEARKAKIATNDETAVIRHASERLIFNALASMILPMFTIHGVVHQMQKLTIKSASTFARSAIPSLSGLAVIPFLPFMFDKPVEMVVERAFNTLWPYEKAYREHHQDAASTDIPVVSPVAPV